MSGLLKSVIWLLPHGLSVRLNRWLEKRAQAPVPQQLLAPNVQLRGRHAGQRCFILGNGPSAKQLDLSVLSGETVISVSNGYLHSGYAGFAPQYHCVPQITYGRMTVEDVVAWFTEMHEKLGEAELFLNETEAELVQKHGLFAGRKVHYLALRNSFDELATRELIDLTGPVPRIESVPVMVLMVAMYLGFTEIVLLGVDHDHFRSGQYVYAFELETQKNKDFSVSNDGAVQTQLHDEFQSLARLWRQYRVLSEVAKTNGVRILNASPGGALDEFPRVSFTGLFEKKP